MKAIIQFFVNLVLFFCGKLYQPEKSTPVYEIRRLEIQDIYTIVKLLKKVGGDTIPNMMISIESLSKKEKKSTNDIVNLGREVIGTLYNAMEKDLVDWFASLIGMSEDEFKKADLEAAFYVLEELTTGAKYRAFFLRAYNLYKTMSKLGTTLKKI